MNHFLKRLLLPLLWLPADGTRRLSGAFWRCFCLAWSRAHLGWGAVPSQNQFLGMIDFDGTCRVRIGQDCRIYKHVRLETQQSGEIVIGDNVVLSPGTVIVSHALVTVGSYTMIGEYTSIRDADHGTDPGRPIREQPHVAAPVTIGRDVWIGRGAAVLKGVTIGDGAVIGANSVVTHDVPPREVWAGAPARFLRQRETGAPIAGGPLPPERAIQDNR